MRIKTATLWDPWGTLVSLNEKGYETRSWATRYRGPLAIHVAQRWQADQLQMVQQEPYRSVLSRHGFLGATDFPLGCVVAVVDLTAVFRTEDVRRDLSHQELAFGDYRNGRFAWKLENLRKLPKPVLAKGAQGLWWWDVPINLVARFGLQGVKV